MELVLVYTILGFETKHVATVISEIASSKFLEGISSDVIVVCPEDKFRVLDLSDADNTILDHVIVGEHQQTYAEVVTSHPDTNKICTEMKNLTYNTTWKYPAESTTNNQ